MKERTLNQRRASEQVETDEGITVAFRARRGEEALLPSKTKHPGETEEMHVVSLIADLRHFCDANDLSFDRILQEANKHYRYEAGLATFSNEEPIE